MATSEPKEPSPSDQPPPSEPSGIRGPFKYTEEFKEALLRAKGEGRALLLVIKDGEWAVDGHVYTLDEIDLKNDSVRLKIIRPVEPTEQKKQLVRSIVKKLRPSLHGSIESAVESALLEKTEGELVIISKSKTGAVTRRRGCFWLDVEGTEVLL